MGKRPVYIIGDNIITSLGFTTGENIAAILQNRTGIRVVNNPGLFPSPISLSLVDTERLDNSFDLLLEKRGKSSTAASFTRLEKMIILSVSDAIKETDIDPDRADSLLVITSTKGNINLLERQYNMIFNHKRLFLWEMARVIQQFFGFRTAPLVISNACISGVLALATAARFLQNGLYRNAVVTGADIVSEFVISGFQSFQALSPLPCKPFDAARNGLSLGEGCGSIVLTTAAPASQVPVRIAGSAVSNDANHISGPSRSGEELGFAINESMREAGLAPHQIDYISAHGTATIFNDEMESKAFELCGLSETATNSFKGYWGHTLGAAGVVESVAAITSVRTGTLFRSAGFEQPGVHSPINVIRAHQDHTVLNVLKTASGFGGCNAAIIYQKV
jgi:3-oxoacyl-[acyl-carrier-protein] synthase-1